MTVREALSEGVAFLVRAEVDTPWLDACLLLGEALGCGKERLVIKYPDDICQKALARYQSLLKQRGDGLPVSYIRRKKEFYGLEFYVDERVLVPRPDTETLVEEARTVLQEKPRIRVLDLCTGSGCLAITLSHLFPKARVTGADVSQTAADVFHRNSLALLNHPLPFILSDLFENITDLFDLIVSNPPYIEREEALIMKESGWPEPLTALDGGEDGTDLLVGIIEQAGQRLTPGGILALEADPCQIKKCEQKMRECGYINIGTRCDLGGRVRVVRGSKIKA
jgi:release factor glutamine methyltransferase